VADTPIPEVDETDSAPPPDPDELRRRAIPVASAPAARAIPVGSTNDLEQRGLQSHQTPIPMMTPSGPPAPPAQGSTADLEARSLNTFEHPKSAPIQTGVASLWTKAQNIHNPVLRVLGEIGAGGARALDVAGQAVGRVIPAVGAVESAIPGTTMNAEANARTATKQEAQTANVEGKQAETAHTEAETGTIPANIKHTEAETKNLESPPPKTDEGEVLHDLMTGGENGAAQVNPATGNPYSYLEAYQAAKAAGTPQSKAEEEGKTVTTDKGVQQWNPDTKRYDIPVGGAPEKGDDFEKYYKDYITSNNLPDSPHNRLQARREYAQAGQAPQKPQQQLAVIDGKVVELKPGMTVPAGTESLTGDLKGAKPTADEQRRSDLSENLNENLATLEEITNRRPDLFGPVAGQITGIKGFIGSNDPDIGTLETIKHQIGMAQISAHGMRSAQGVSSAAESILNSFKNGPDAVKASINAARNSVKTFTEDANRSTTKGAAPKTEAGDDLKPPKDADPGMKWQHKTADGKTQWRQVKAQ
jgi:hypothetical protein